jgi:hypothetical protein
MVTISNIARNLEIISEKINVVGICTGGRTEVDY